MKKLTFFPVFFLFCLIPYIASAQPVISDFESGSADGWISEGDGISYYEAGTGNPGGCLRVDDDATGNWNNAYAPVKFLGDWSAATPFDYLSADVFVHHISGPYGTGTYVFHIKGPGGEARAFVNAQPPYEVWNNYTVFLEASSWTIISGTFNDILLDVNEFVVRAEYVNGDEFVRLDNVQLSFTPVVQTIEPTVCSDFENGLFEGWSFQNTGGAVISATGGNPGKYVKITDGTGISLAVLPSRYLGNWSLLDNHAAEIHVDYNIFGFSGSLLIPDFWMKISGPGGEAIYPATNTITAAFNQWHSFGIPIDPAGWTVTSGSWNSLLSNVTQAVLTVEFINGTETVGIDNFCISDLPPVAGFSANKQFLFPGDAVPFTDHSSSAPVSWSWDFGDGGTGTEQNPTYTYNSPGFYDVSLTATNYFGSDTELRPGYIEVYPISQCLKWEDDFTDNQIHAGYTLINGTWAETGETMRQTSNYYSGNLLGGCYALTGSYFWTDYSISSEIYSTDDDNMGFVFNYQNPTNMYMFVWNKQNSLRKLSKWVNGTETVLASDAVAYAANTWYNVAITTHNGSIIVYIDGAPVFDVTDNTFLSGKVALYCHSNQSTWWDNFIVICNGIELDVKVMLEGPFNGSTMNTSLNAFLPLDHPFDPALPYFGNPDPMWYYTGTESVAAIPSGNIVDWLLLELRDAPDAASATGSTVIARKPVFVFNDGKVSDLDGTSLPVFNTSFTTNLFVVVWHRNHLGIMSASPAIQSGNTWTYDFTLSAGQVYGSALAQKELAPGIWGMISGDGDANGNINNADKNSVWRTQAGLSGYLAGDFNLDSQVNSVDKIDRWSPNSGRGCQVPD